MTADLFPTFTEWSRYLRTLRTKYFPTFTKGIRARWSISPWWNSDSRENQSSLLRILSIAHQERLELAPLVACLASEHRGRYRYELYRLSKRLGSGTPLIAALEQTPLALNEDAVLSLRFASQTGTLSETYQQLLDNGSPRTTQTVLQWHDAKTYWFVLAVVLLLLLAFQAIFLVPTLKKMSEEFNVQLPPSFLSLVKACDLLSSVGGPIFCLVFIAGTLSWSWRVRRFARLRIASFFSPQVTLARCAHLLKLLSTTVLAGRPLPSALSTLARYHFDRRIRQRLLFARNEVEQGEDVWKSLVQARVLSSKEAMALQSSPTASVRAWALGSMAEGKNQTAEYQTARRIELVKPLIVLFFAALVLWMSYAYFSVLTSFIFALDSVQ